MDQLRTIKKYSNRRLYDTVISRYITLDEVKEYVLNRINFKIVDVNTDEDMTDYVLLQIITASESAGSPIFTTEILKNIICFYGNPFQKWMSQTLEKSFSMLVDQQTNFQKNLKETPFSDITEMLKNNIAFWQDSMNKYSTTKPEASKKNSRNTKSKTKK